MRAGFAESANPVASGASIELELLTRFDGERAIAEAKRRSSEVRYGF
jgi:hypothetical protein